jgi:RNA polymerase sigma factor (sigma-70 family)
MPLSNKQGNEKQMSANISDVVAMPGLAAALSLHSGEPGDESLISALAGGAVWAMDLLYQRYSGLLYSLAYRVVADLRVAEDLLQEVFLAVWQHAPSYDPQSGSVSSWLTSIMRHRAIDYLRRTHRRNTSNDVPWEVSEQDQNMASPDVWDEAWRSVQSSLVRECLMRLLPEQRTVIELAYFEGRTQSEIARICQVPLGTVKARMRLALRHLKRELEKRGMSDL